MSRKPCPKCKGYLIPRQFWSDEHHGTIKGISCTNCGFLFMQADKESDHKTRKSYTRPKPRRRPDAA